MTQSTKNKLGFLFCTMILLVGLATELKGCVMNNVVSDTQPTRAILTAEQIQSIKALKYRTIEPINETFTAQITAYCKCAKCCGKSDGIGASGHKMQVGQVAASRQFKFGTRLKISGKVYTVTDRLAKRYDSRVDIYCNSHEEALKLGIKTEKVEVIK